MTPESNGCHPIREGLWDHTDPPPCALTLTGQAADSLLLPWHWCTASKTSPCAGPDLLGPFPSSSLPSLTQREKGTGQLSAPLWSPGAASSPQSQSLPSPAQGRRPSTLVRPHSLHGVCLTQMLVGAGRACVCPWVPPLGTRDPSAPRPETETSSLRGSAVQTQSSSVCLSR